MPLTIQLPRPLDEELIEEAQREGVSATEHAALLLYLAHALVSEGRPTPFSEAVRAFLARHSLDAAQVSAAFEELLRLCLKQDEGCSPLEKADGTLAQGDLSLLTQWRNALVHGVEAGAEAIPATLPRVQRHAGITPVICLAAGRGTSPHTPRTSRSTSSTLPATITRSCRFSSAVTV